jgi:hypothetical protein
MMKILLSLALALSIVVGAVGASSADGVTDAIGRANSAYSSGDYKDASTELQTALVGVNQKLIDLLVAKFPAAPSGWTAEEPEGIDASAVGAGFFATLVVSRTYYPPNSSSIDVSISANSPMLFALRAFIANPMLASMTGQTAMKKVEACGYDAVETVDNETGSYELLVLAGNATLIGFEGEIESDMGHIRTLVGTMDCAGVVAVVE